MPPGVASVGPLPSRGLVTGYHLREQVGSLRNGTREIGLACAKYDPFSFDANESPTHLERDIAPVGRFP